MNTIIHNNCTGNSERLKTGKHGENKLCVRLETIICMASNVL